jgi:hypothetical protein
LGWRAVRSTSPIFEVKDGRRANITNSGFGTVFAVVDGAGHPVCDYAGFAPFGFGYRRCPGEQLTIQVFEDFLRKVWRDKIVFRKLNLFCGESHVAGRLPKCLASTLSYGSKHQDVDISAR